MPPKVKLTKENVLAAALDLVRREGIGALNARDLAGELNCSTQPIFSNFVSMSDVRDSVVVAAYELYAKRTAEEMASGEYPPYKASGMAYIRFAKDEPHLFAAIFMRERRENAPLELERDPVTETAISALMNCTGLSYDDACTLHLEMWLFVHGVASLYVTGFSTPPLDKVSELISDVYHGVVIYRKEKKNEND